MLVAILFGHSKDYDMKAPSKKACFGYNKFRRTEILYFFRKSMKFCLEGTFERRKFMQR